MTVRRYEREDFDQIANWAREGYGTDYEEHQFPETGFIVDGVAAYFLYQTDSSICYLENLISNPKADVELKAKGITLVVDALLEEAKEQGFSVAYATTGIPTVVFRAMQYGAHAQAKQTLLTKKL